MRLMTLIGFILISLLSATEGWGASSYSYDALGNMRGYVIDDYRHARHLTLDYHYDARNRLINFVNERGGSFDQAYDSYGRITTGHNRLTQYDHSHRPTSVTHNGGRQYAFVFDGNLHRARETIAGVTTYSVYSAGTLLLRDNITDGEQTDYVRLGGHTIARLKTDSAGVTTVIYPHTNHLGSPVAATDGNGDLLWREEYTPFGRKHENAPGQRGEEGFTGHIFDGQNTVHMKARTYMTTSYRFTTPDPVTFLSSGLDPAYFNRYAYVANDPVNAVDPDGRQTTALASPFLRSLGNPNSKARQVVRTGVVAGSLAVPGPEDLVIGAAAAKFGGNLLKGGKAADGLKPCCFTAGTLIETEDGLKPIETIKVGDKVWAHNPETGETALKDVTDFIPAHDREIWKVAVEGKTSSEVFETTHEHPWWVLGEDGNGGAWKETHELKPGMRVIARGDLDAPRLILASTDDVRAVAPDRIMTIASVENTRRIDATYNITVDDFHTYFVGEQRVLVHNCKVNLASDKRTNHILNGDKTGGGHLAGTGKPGKSEFPASMSGDDIMHHASDIATKPNPSGGRGPGRLGRTVSQDTVDGVDIRVVDDGKDIITAHPTNVPRNPQ